MLGSIAEYLGEEQDTSLNFTMEETFENFLYHTKLISKYDDPTAVQEVKERTFSEDLILLKVNNFFILLNFLLGLLEGILHTMYTVEQ